MSETIKIAALGALLALGASVGVLSIVERYWPTPTVITLAGIGPHLFVAYVMFLGALFAAYSMPTKNRAFAIFGILAAATALGFVVLNAVPLNETNWLLVVGLTLSLFAALAIYSLVWGLWGLISGAVAFWKKPPPRLNGWQRIGIVASIVWAIAAHVHTMNQQNWASGFYLACVERANVPAADCRKSFDRDLPTALAEQRQRAVANALVPVALGWVFAYGLIGIIRWIREGFRPARLQ